MMDYSVTSLEVVLGAGLGPEPWIPPCFQGKWRHRALDSGQYGCPGALSDGSGVMEPVFWLVGPGSAGESHDRAALIV